MPESSLLEIRRAHGTRDGAGMVIQRLHDFSGALDPLLMMDELQSPAGSEALPGFPDHPHRGFETLTLLRRGAMNHSDHLGNRGRIEAGGAQWMRAGRGVIHSEMPQAGPEGLQAFQLWINLPASGRMAEPCYADIEAQKMPVLDLDPGTLTAVAGRWQLENSESLVDGPIEDLGMQSAGVAWLSLPPGGSTGIALGPSERLLVRVVSGALINGPAAAQLGLYAGGDCVRLNAGPEPLLAILVRGGPLDEPIAQHGPFVMNHPEEIHQALEDYRAGRLTGP